MKNLKKLIKRWIKGPTRSFHVPGAKAWRPNFVTSITTTLTSLDTFVRAARGIGPPAEPFAMCLSAPAAVKRSHLAGRDYRRRSQRVACLTLLVGCSSWISTRWWESGKRRSTEVSGIFFKARGGDAPPIVKVVNDLPPVCLVVPREK